MTEASRRLEAVLPRVRDRSGFFRLVLGEALGWPAPEGTGSSTVLFSQPRANQPWQVLLVELASGEAAASTRALAPRLRRLAAGLAAPRAHLLFLCTQDYGEYRIAYLRPAAGGPAVPPLASFGWGPGAPPRSVLEHQLAALEWPAQDESSEAWLARWANAFDAEQVARRFREDYERVLEQVEQVFALGGPSTEARDRARALLDRRLRECFVACAVRSPSDGLFEPGPDDARLAALPAEALRLVDGAGGLLARHAFTPQESTTDEIEAAVEPEMLGRLFEAQVTARREAGAWYTPRPVVAFMCRAALKLYLKERSRVDDGALAAFVDRRDAAGLPAEEAARVLRALETVRAVDPACGAGAYLVGLLQELTTLHEVLDRALGRPAETSRCDLQRTVFERNLYGVDLDPEAVRLAGFRLSLALAVEGAGSTQTAGARLHIETGDSLLGHNPERETAGDGGGFDWRGRFGEVFAKHGGFDIVLANPPYVRHEALATGAKRRLLRLYPDAAEARSDLYCYFFARGLQLLRPGGVQVLVCANGWLDVGYGGKLQGYLLRHAHVRELYDSAVERQFAGAGVNTLLSILVKGCAGDAAPTRFLSLRGPFERAVTEPALRREVVLTRRELWEAGLGEPDAHGVRAYEGEKWGGKYLRAPDVFLRVLEKARPRLCKLGELAEIERGYTTGANDFFYLTPVAGAGAACDEVVRVRNEAGWEGELEREYLRPVAKGPREVRTLRVESRALRCLAFVCRDGKEELREKGRLGALSYVEWGERQRSRGHQGKQKAGVPLPELASFAGRERWHDLGERRSPSFLCNRFFHDRFFFACPAVPVLVDQTFYGGWWKGGVDGAVALAFLNSTLQALFTEVLGRVALGEGVLQYAVYEMRRLQVVAPPAVALPANERAALLRAFDRLAGRELGSIFEELGCAAASAGRGEAASAAMAPSLNGVRADRRALDAVVFRALGLGEEEQLEVYRAVVEMVGARLRKAGSV